MKMRSTLVLATVGLIVAASGSAFGQSVGASRGLPGSGSYTITGKVVLPSGTPAVDVKVDVSCDFTNVSAYTDSDGAYRATGLPAGNCTVTARVPGFDPLTEHRQIQRDTPYGQGIYIPIFIRANPFSSPAYSGIPKAAIDKYKSAIEKIEKGDNDGALVLLEQAIAIHGNFAQAWYQKGVTLRKKNEVDKAIEAYVKAIEANPEYLEAKYAFGLAQFEKKNYEVSEAVFRDVIKQKSDMPEAHLNLGMSLFHLKKTDEAEAELKTVIAAKAGVKLAMAHLYLGQIYAQKKRNAEAAGELQKYVELVPNAPNAERIKTVIADLKKQS